MLRVCLLVAIASVSALQAAAEGRVIGDAIEEQEVDLQMYNDLNAEAFLRRCQGSTGVAEYRKLLLEENVGVADSATCVAGNCPESLQTVLLGKNLKEFFSENCCVGDGVLYIAFRSADRIEWTYLFGHGLPETRLIAACLGVRAEQAVPRRPTSNGSHTTKVAP